LLLESGASAPIVAVSFRIALHVPQQTAYGVFVSTPRAFVAWRDALCDVAIYYIVLGFVIQIA
jgi:hypothetical protein